MDPQTTWPRAVVHVFQGLKCWPINQTPKKSTLNPNWPLFLKVNPPKQTLFGLMYVFFSLFQSNKSPEILALKSPPLWSVFHLGKKRLFEKKCLLNTLKITRDAYKLFFQETLLQTSYTGPMLWLIIGTTNNWYGQKQETSWRIRGEVRICGCPKGHW